MVGNNNIGPSQTGGGVPDRMGRVFRSGALIYGSYKRRFMFATERRRFCRSGNFMGRPRHYGPYHSGHGGTKGTPQRVRRTMYTTYNNMTGIPFLPHSSHPMCYDRYFTGVGRRSTRWFAGRLPFWEQLFF